MNIIFNSFVVYLFISISRYTYFLIAGASYNLNKSFFVNELYSFGGYTVILFLFFLIKCVADDIQLTIQKPILNSKQIPSENEPEDARTDAQEINFPDDDDIISADMVLVNGELNNQEIKKLLNSFSKLLFPKYTVGKNNSHIVALEAPWGYGKSSFYNVFKGCYEKDLLDEGIDQNISFYDYDPWISPSGSITSDFLTYLESIIYTETGKDIGTNIQNYIFSLMDNFSQDNIINSLITIFSRKKSFYSEKKAVSKKIEESISSSRNIDRLVILIDNLDRLYANQIIEVLELVKSVSDFPYITFVLAYDTEHVHSAITEELNVDPNRYLEKIVSKRYSILLDKNNVYMYLRNFIFYGYCMKYTINEENKNILFEIITKEVFRKKYLDLYHNKENLEFRTEPYQSRSGHPPVDQTYIVLSGEKWSSYIEYISDVKDDISSLEVSEVDLSNNDSPYINGFSLMTKYNNGKSNIVSKLIIHKFDEIYYQNYDNFDKLSANRIALACEDVLTCRNIKRILSNIDISILNMTIDLEKWKQLRDDIREVLSRDL